MHYNARHLFPAATLALAFASVAAPIARAQVTGNTDVNLSQKTGGDTECAISKNPSNKNQLFFLCNTNGAGLFAARSTDGGLTWSYPDPSDKTIADGDPNQGAAACCDPTLAWDTFGNLFITYIDNTLTTVVTLLSTDGGATFSTLATNSSCVQCVDQPTIVAANTSAPGAPVAVWIVWNLAPAANQAGQMVARGAAVTGLGAANIGAFGALQTIPGTVNCSYGDVAIAPTGVVVQACGNPSTGGEGPSTIFVNIDADGLGPGNFGPATIATTSNVGGFDVIPPQPTRTTDPEAGLAFDNAPGSPHLGRLYLVYTEETVNENNDTDIMVRFSDDNGVNWSAPIRVNDDPAAPVRSQFLPKIALNRLSGNITVCWLDARNSGANTAVQEFCSMATPGGATPVFFANAQIADAASTMLTGFNYGDYAGLTYFQGTAHPAWGDASNSTLNNPDGTASLDAYTDRVSGGAAAMEGDPHVTSVSGIHYDFQGAGDFVALRDGDGMQIQTRETPVATTFTPGPDPYDGVAVNVSVNTAVAARVGSHRVSYQPNVSGVPDPSGLQLRVDGALTTLTSSGLDLGDGGRIVKSAIAGAIEIDFPDGTLLVVTPGFWSSQSTWYLNVDAYHTPALEGIMGAIAPGNWLPALPDGTLLGAMPPSAQQRYTDLYDRFGEAWRVSRQNTLFDYPPPSSQTECLARGWPKDRPSCIPRENPPAKAIPPQVIETLCRPIIAKGRRADCVFDLRATGERGFVTTYLATQLIDLGATTTALNIDKDSTNGGEPITLTASVRRKISASSRAPTGAVQFSVDGERFGRPVRLDSNGHAALKSPLKPGRHTLVATFVPAKGGGWLSSTSPEAHHTVTR